MPLVLYNSAEPPQGARSSRSIRACADVCLRADGLRPRAYRQRPRRGRVRRAVPAAAPALRQGMCAMCATSPTSTTRSTPRRATNGEPIAALTARTTAIYHDDMAALGSAAAGRSSRARPSISPNDRDDRAADRRRATPMRPRAMCCSRVASYAEYGTSVAPQPRRLARRRAGRCGAL